MIKITIVTHGCIDFCVQAITIWRPGLKPWTLNPIHVHRPIFRTQCFQHSVLTLRIFCILLVWTYQGLPLYQEAVVQRPSPTKQPIFRRPPFARTGKSFDSGHFIVFKNRTSLSWRSTHTLPTLSSKEKRSLAAVWLENKMLNGCDCSGHTNRTLCLTVTEIT